MTSGRERGCANHHQELLDLGLQSPLSLDSLCAEASSWLTAEQVSVAPRLTSAMHATAAFLTLPAARFGNALRGWLPPAQLQT